MDIQIQAFTFILAAVVGVALTAIALGAGMLLGAEFPSWLEVAAVYTSFACTFLFVIERRQAYVWGVVTTVLYTKLFWDFGLQGSAVIQVYLLGALFYGFFRWGRDEDTRPITTVRPLYWWGAYAALTLVTWYGAVFISTSFGSPILPWDSAILALSILAQWLLDNKKLETWGVWILINVIATPLYWSQGLTLTSVQYFVFGLNAVWALTMWYTSMSRTSRQLYRLRIAEEDQARFGNARPVDDYYEFIRKPNETREQAKLRTFSDRYGVTKHGEDL